MSLLNGDGVPYVLTWRCTHPVVISPTITVGWTIAASVYLLSYIIVLPHRISLTWARGLLLYPARWLGQILKENWYQLVKSLQTEMFVGAAFWGTSFEAQVLRRKFWGASFEAQVLRRTFWGESFEAQVLRHKFWGASSNHFCWQKETPGSTRWEGLSDVEAAVKPV